MTVKNSDIFKCLETWAPKDTAADWDTVGLQIGNPNNACKTITLSLDVDHALLRHIQNTPTDLVITHHPIFYKAISQIDLTTDMGEIIETFIQKNTSLYTLHTNLDAAEGGVNDCLIETYKLDPTSGKVMNSDGIGKYFKLDTPTPLSHFINTHPCTPIFQTKTPSTQDTPINRVAFCGGSGRSLLKKAKALEIDLFITGELGYHDQVYCQMNGINVILLGHKESEIWVLPKLKSVLESTFTGLSIHICQ